MFPNYSRHLIPVCITKPREEYERLCCRHDCLKHIFLDFINTMIKVEFYSYLHNCHLPIELFIHILHPWPYGIVSAFCLDLSKFCEWEKKFFLEQWLLVHFLGLWSSFFFFLLVLRKSKFLKTELSQFSLLTLLNRILLWTSAWWICLCLKDCFELLSLEDTRLQRLRG